MDTFTDPEDALRSFVAERYDIAVLDVRMPKMSGFQLYKEILKRDANIRVRFFTAFEEYRQEFKKAFPEHDEARFTKKPLTMSALVQKLNDN